MSNTAAPPRLPVVSLARLKSSSPDGQASGIVCSMYSSTRVPPAPQEEHFRFSALGQQHEQLRKFRGRMRTFEGDAVASLFATGRQDFLHALGFELDDAGAEAIGGDQLDDSVVLSYAYVDPSADFSWHKRMALLHQADIELVTKVARGRRRNQEQRAGLFDGFRRGLRSGSNR